MSSPTEQNDSGVIQSATAPLLQDQQKDETKAENRLATVGSVSANEKSDRPLSSVSAPTAATAIQQTTLSNEYRFVHQRIPPRKGKLRYVLPVLLLGFQAIFIVLFAIFGKYDEVNSNSDQLVRKYPMFEDLHALTLLGFGFLMTFLKRYGYGSVGFNLLLVAFVVQWALIIRGWIEWNYNHDATFKIGIENLVFADFTAIAVLISFGAVLGKTTLTQLIVLAIIEVVFQVFNEYLNIYIIKTYDVGRSVYVHLFGALFGLGVSKALHFRGVHSSKQASVYHSDLFSLIGTLFLWVYYPSFNGLLAKSSVASGQSKAIINTFSAISASCVVTFGVSALAGKGKLSVLHVQHATIAGGIAIGSVADLNLQIYIALIVGSIAGLLSTIGYQYIDPCLTKFLKLHDTSSVQSLHGIPGLIAAILGAIFAAVSSYNVYGQALYDYYPARLPVFNSTEFFDQNIDSNRINGQGRGAGEQAGFQLIGLLITIGIALASGVITGLILRLPIFEQLSQEVEMFDDEAQWVTPDDYALKLTFANTPQANHQLQASNDTNDKKEDTKV